MKENNNSEMNPFGLSCLAGYVFGILFGFVFLFSSLSVISGSGVPLVPFIIVLPSLIIGYWGFFLSAPLDNLFYEENIIEAKTRPALVNIGGFIISAICACSLIAGTVLLWIRLFFYW